MYHGPTTVGAAEKILAEGFRLNKKPEETSQQYGSGIYLASSIERAKSFRAKNEPVLKVSLEFDPENLLSIIGEQRSGFPFETGREITLKLLSRLEKRIDREEVYADHGDASWEGIEKVRARAIRLCQECSIWVIQNSFPWSSEEEFLTDLVVAAGKQGLLVVSPIFSMSNFDLVVWDPRIISGISVVVE